MDQVIFMDFTQDFSVTLNLNFPLSKYSAQVI